MKKFAAFALLYSLSCAGFEGSPPEPFEAKTTPRAEYFVTADQTHNKFSSTIRPVLRVPSGAIIQAHTQEARGHQLSLGSTVADWEKVNADLIHALTGPVYVEGARVGDVLAVTLHEIELGDRAWSAIVPGFGFLTEEFQDAWLRTFKLGADTTHVQFNDRIRIPVRPFPGVMGVARRPRKC